MARIRNWFDEKSQTKNQIDQRATQGSGSFDGGFFQTRPPWHGQCFSPIDPKIDPFETKRYTARISEIFYQEIGILPDAARGIQLRMPLQANRYRQRFQHIRLKLGMAWQAQSTKPSEIQKAGSTSDKPTVNPARIPAGNVVLIPVCEFPSLGTSGSVARHDCVVRQWSEPVCFFWKLDRSVC